MYGLKFRLRSLKTGITREVYFCGFDHGIVTYSENKMEIKNIPNLTCAKVISNTVKKKLGYDYGYYIGRIQLL